MGLQTCLKVADTICCHYNHSPASLAPACSPAVCFDAQRVDMTCNETQHHSKIVQLLPSPLLARPLPVAKQWILLMQTLICARERQGTEHALLLPGLPASLPSI